MSTFTERLKIILDFDSNATTTGLKKVRQEIKDADGPLAKMKSGIGGLGQMASSPLVLASGMTAAGAALFGAAEGAANLGVEIGKVSDATGLSTEATSRWLEVGKAMGIGSDQIAGLIEKMTKNLGATPAKFEAMGISVKHAENGTVDMSATLLNAMDVLSKVQDPTKRAAEGAALFGKSWATAAELIDSGAGNISKRLDEVAGSKVYSPAQVAESRKFRDEMHALTEEVSAAATEIGKDMIPVVVELAKDALVAYKAVKDLAGGLEAIGHGSGINDKFKGLRDAWDSMGATFIKTDTAIHLGIRTYDDMFKAIADGKIKVSDLEGAIAQYNATQSATNVTTGSQLQLLRATEDAFAMGQTTFVDAARAQADIANAAAQAAESLARVKTKWDILTADLAANKSLNSTEQALLGFKDTIAKLDDDFKHKKITGEQYFLGIKGAGIDARQSILDYAKSLGDVPPDVVTKIISEFDPANPEKTFATLQTWFDNHPISATVQSKPYVPPGQSQGPGSTSTQTGAGASHTGNIGPHLNVNVHLGGQHLKTVKVALDQLGQGTR